MKKYKVSVNDYCVIVNRLIDSGLLSLEYFCFLHGLKKVVLWKS